MIAMGDIILKYGDVASDKPDDTQWAGIWLEQDGCKACLSLFGIELQNSNIVSNRIVGIDYTYKPFLTDAGAMRLSVGFSVAEKAINDSEQANFHLGWGLVGYNCIAKNVHCGIHYDHFSNGRKVLDRDHIERNEPLDLLSIGISF